MNRNRNLVKSVTLENVFNDYMEGKGIFHYLSQIETMPWSEYVDDFTLDIEYIGNHSGEKLISPLLNKLLTEQGLSEENRLALARLVWAKFQFSWVAKWKTMFFEYNPIHNYDRTEEYEDGTEYGKVIDNTGNNSHTLSGTDKTQYKGTETDAINGKETNTKTGNVENAYTGKESNTRNGKDTLTMNGSETDEHSKFAFNSNSYSNDTKDTKTYTNRTDDREYTALKDEKEYTNRKDTETYNNVKDVLEYTGRENVKSFTNREDDLTYGKKDTYEQNLKEKHSGKDTTKHKGHLYGNIGITTTQQMITDERKVWDWSYFDGIFEDIDTILTIGSFGEGDPNYIDHIELTIPMASALKLGGVKANAKSGSEQLPVNIDAFGFLWADGVSTNDFLTVTAALQEEDLRIHEEMNSLWVNVDSCVKTVNNIGPDENGNVNVPGGGGSTVSVTQDQTTGDMVGKIIVDGVQTQLYSKPAPVQSVNGQTGIVNIPTGDSVSVTQSQTSGDAVGEITVNGNTTTLYSPTAPVQSVNGQTGVVNIPTGDAVSVTQTLTSGTEIGQIDINGTSTTLYAPNGLPSGGSNGDVLTKAVTGPMWAPPINELPVIHSGDAGKILTVNSTENGVEWGSNSGSSISVVPTITTGQPVAVIQDGQGQYINSIYNGVYAHNDLIPMSNTVEDTSVGFITSYKITLNLDYYIPAETNEINFVFNPYSMSEELDPSGSWFYSMYRSKELDTGSTGLFAIKYETGSQTNTIRFKMSELGAITPRTLPQFPVYSVKIKKVGHMIMNETYQRWDSYLISNLYLGSATGIVDKLINVDSTNKKQSDGVIINVPNGAAIRLISDVSMTNSSSVAESTTQIPVVYYGG